MPSDPEALDAAARACRAAGWPAPDTLLVSGSGLAVELEGEIVVSADLASIAPFPIHPLPGHEHRLEVIRLPSGRNLLYQRGRIHSYQGYSASDTVFVVRLAALLGADTLLMTSAVGAVDPGLRVGDLVALRDHLNLTGLNPLRGRLPEAWGPRFPDMTEAYSPRLRRLAAELAAELGVGLAEAVYAGVPGPSYETPAEVAMLRTLGADVVGMSTVLEVVAARHMGLECLCLGLVTNAAAGTADGLLDHDDVLAEGARAAATLKRLLSGLVGHVELSGGRTASSAARRTG